MSTPRFSSPARAARPPACARSSSATRPSCSTLVLAEVGADPFERVDEGTGSPSPRSTAPASPAGPRRATPRRRLLAGHSLGELTALAAAGAIEPVDAVAARGRPRPADADAGGEAPGGMMALLGDGDAARAAAAASDVSDRERQRPDADRRGRARRRARRRGRRGEGARRAHDPAADPGRIPLAGDGAGGGAVPRRARARSGSRPPGLPVFSSTAGRPFEPIPTRSATGSPPRSSARCAGARRCSRCIVCGVRPLRRGRARQGADRAWSGEAFDDVEAAVLDDGGAHA